MRAYVMTSGAIFGLLAVAHVWRVIVEGWRVAADPFFALITIAAAALSLWALRLTRLSLER